MTRGAKRQRPSTATTESPNKRKPTPTPSGKFDPIKVATRENAAAVDANLPLEQLLDAVGSRAQDVVEDGECVVYWMRMQDMRIEDNRALALASAEAQKTKKPLVVIYVISPQDYAAHDRGARRIDFMLRNLRIIRIKLDEMHIPLHVVTHSPRSTLPRRIISLLSLVGAHKLYANIEYEVDELRRDIQVCEFAKKDGMKATFVHDKCIVEPGVAVKKDGSYYAVYSPFQRLWLATLNDYQGRFLDPSPEPAANNKNVRKHEKLGDLFNGTVPESVEGFELDEVDRKKMAEYWPAGEEAALLVLDRFLSTKSRPEQAGGVNPLSQGAEESDKHSRIQVYGDERDRVNADTTSRISPYLASGIISARRCVRSTMKLTGSSKVDGGRNTGIGRWVQELAWRDFYVSVLVGFPRVSMGRPFIEKYADIVWEGYQEPAGKRASELEGKKGRSINNGAEHSTSKGKGHSAMEIEDSGDIPEVKAWKEGRTGYPIVDAGMRCIKETGWLHNRLRMTTAMFLVKDLMVDWRVGERYYMQNLIDGDLASNNGGWQWSASTGVDPAPYFRIFNPYLQSEKADREGDFIRMFVPELKSLKGKEIHNPPAAVAKRLGYPLPIVKHSEAKERAIRRFKTPGEK
ncbi:DNA photolyase, FAD-binding/Cryptochrome [Schizophyllum commune]